MWAIRTSGVSEQEGSAPSVFDGPSSSALVDDAQTVREYAQPEPSKTDLDGMLVRLPVVGSARRDRALCRF